jgi:hypothetical protein
MASVLDMSITGTPSLSIVERRLQHRNSQVQVTYTDDSLQIPCSIDLSPFEGKVDLTTSPTFMTPLPYWSPDKAFMSLPAASQSNSPSSSRSSFSDILDEDDDYSSGSNVDIFEARRETFQRAQPQRLRWQAGSLRAAYAKMQAEYEDSSSESDKSVDGEEGGETPAISRPVLHSLPSVAVMENSDSSKTSFFHHNTLRRHNSTGNYTRAQLSKKDLAAGLAMEIQEEGTTKNRVVKSGGTSSNRLYASKRTSRTHRKQIVMSSRESSLEEHWKMLQASNNLNRTRRLTISLGDDNTMPATPPDSQPSSPQPYKEANDSLDKGLLYQPVDITPQKTTTSISGHKKTLSQSSSFSLTDKLFSGIKLLR